MGAGKWFLTTSLGIKHFITDCGTKSLWNKQNSLMV